MKTFPVLAFSVSAATRQARNNEKKGGLLLHERGRFQAKIQNKEFAEWEMVYEGKYYGTFEI